MKLGEKVVIGGLCIQVLVFGFFIIVATMFNLGMIKVPTPEAQSPPTIPWRQHLYVLYIASLFTMIRSIFRVIEYIMRNDGYLLRTEVFLYIFDAVLMLVVMVVFKDKMKRGTHLRSARRRKVHPPSQTTS